MKAVKECPRAAARDDAPNPLGIAVMLVLGAAFALAPRMGWESSAYGLDVFTFVILATSVVTGITFVARLNSAGDRARGGSARRGAPRPEGAGRKDSCARRPGAQPASVEAPKRVCPPDVRKEDTSVELATNKAGSGARAAAPERPRAGLDRTTPAGDSSDEDPVWNTDWATLQPQPGQPAEVFEMNDTPTWLARLQHRRNQAERAGKKKLVQKIDREIADASLKARSLSKGALAQVSTCAAESSSVQAGSSEDIWSMDWAELACEQ
mmetsp:Transcript_84692/g.224923  ORF Transcript_84692/g.224923 Transcript_84692/m.224923 type:complete len:267 (-) Transcript_84692:216-1016(-)